MYIYLYIRIIRISAHVYICMYIQYGWVINMVRMFTRCKYSLEYSRLGKGVENVRNAQKLDLGC